MTNGEKVTEKGTGIRNGSDDGMRDEDGRIEKKRESEGEGDNCCDGTRDEDGEIEKDRESDGKTEKSSDGTRDEDGETDQSWDR